MFDARVHFDEETKENKEKITKLLDASLEFQKNKQAEKYLNSNLKNSNN